ncbi:MAG TPA: hypothetical protein PLA50_07855, partial [Bacteroidia bacterium]|nr:hypothetical protein [Bacteroidia bacterium]
MTGKSPRLLLRMVAPVAMALAMGGCDKDLVERVDRLEAELRGVRSDTRETVDDLKGRVIAAENKVGVSSGGKTLDQRIASLEGTFGEVLAMKSRENEMVYLRANLQGHAPLLTDHGTFLVRLGGIDLDLEGGFTVHLDIGNPQAIAVQQFTLRGDYGGGTPELPEGEDYDLRNEKLKAWQESLKPFEAHVSKTLEPFVWTSFDIGIPAASREELEMIRFSMIVENAQLVRQSGGGGGESGSQYAHIDVDSKAASVLKTEYGAFLVSVKSAEQTEVGTKLHLEIGNPYGFTLNQSRIVGDYGTARPKRADSVSEAEFSERMTAWSATLQPFESMISSKISNFRWSKATILVPGKVEDVKFLRCQLRVEDVTLP